MPKRNPHSGLVGISLHLPMKTLEKIQKQQGKNLSEKIRKIIEIGLKKEAGVAPPYPHKGE